LPSWLGKKGVVLRTKGWGKGKNFAGGDFRPFVGKR